MAYTVEATITKIEAFPIVALQPPNQPEFTVTTIKVYAIRKDGIEISWERPLAEAPNVGSLVTVTIQ